MEKLLKIIEQLVKNRLKWVNIKIYYRKLQKNYENRIKIDSNREKNVEKQMKFDLNYKQNH